LGKFSSKPKLLPFVSRPVSYGPWKPHFGQRYGLPNFLHLLHLQIIISPQFGHGNFVGSVPGAIILWHDVHTGMVTVTLVFSAILPHLQSSFVMDILVYIYYVK